MERTRNMAAANEANDISLIVNSINNRTEIGSRIVTSFREKFGNEITAARSRSGSSRGTHYDFEVEVDGRWMKVEHKGGQRYRYPNPDDAPWKAGVQFHNGGCEKYSIARKYAQTWYDIHVASGSLKDEFNVTSPIPAFEEWFSKDCRVQDDPKTAFGKELKQNVRSARGPRASLLDKRASVLDALHITEEDKHTLATEVLPVANQALLQKDYWLSIHGNLESDFYAVWYPQFTIDEIRHVDVKKQLDVKVTFTCSNNFTFHAILRWGKGAGFSCLRMDLK